LYLKNNNRKLVSVLLLPIQPHFGQKVVQWNPCNHEVVKLDSIFFLSPRVWKSSDWRKISARIGSAQGQNVQKERKKYSPFK
jgi:hypothetical protein